MKEKRVQFSNIVKNQLPNYVVEEFPLISEFLSQYYISQEFKGAPADLIQNIDRYIKIDELTDQTDSTILDQNVSSFDTIIPINQSGVGIEDFPDSYGVLQIDNEIITYTGKTSNSFTGCIRGFVGITSFTKQNYPDQLVFTESQSAEHNYGAVIKNLSSLFMKEFLLKTKYQLLPGFENRTLSSNINQSLFIKQAKDFYLSKGTDESFKILFNALYGESATIIRPKEYLFRPSDANYKITDDLVVEKIEGNPLNLLNATLFQNEYQNISKAYASIGDVEIITSELGTTYYKLSLDSGYSRDIGVNGAIYGNFTVHPKTRVIGRYASQSFVVTAVSNSGTPPPNNVYAIDGILQKEITLQKGKTYRFDTSDSSNSGHPFIFQTLLGDELSLEYYFISNNEISGQSRSFVNLTIAPNAPNETIKYNCSNHNGMGANIIITTNPADGLLVIDVDSTVGFPNSGDLSVTYNDSTSGTISYSSKNINQFFNCSGIVGIIEDKSQIGINTYAYANVSNETIKVRINSVIKSCSIGNDTRYYHPGDTAQIRTLGVDVDNYLFNNWFLNIISSYEISTISLENTFDYTYNIAVKTPHTFKIGDSVKITSSSGSEKFSTISNVISSTSFSISGQGVLSNDQYIIRKNLLKVNSNTFQNLYNINSNVQNLYKLNEKLLIASPSLPTYYNQPLNINNKSTTFSGTFPLAGVGSTNIFKITSITDHGFYTGDIVYYTPEIQTSINIYSLDEENTVISSLFDEGIYYVKRIDQNNIQLANSRDNIYYSNFKYVSDVTSVNNNTIELYDFKSKTLLSQKLLREVSIPINDGGIYPTNAGFTGILINGVEILNYKSSDLVYYGELQNINVTAPGSGYDVVTPPTLIISDAVGYGATGYCAVKGFLSEIRIIDTGFDYQSTPKINITGGNGVGANASVNMKLIDHESSFNSESPSALVGIGSTVSTIGFGTYHKFRNSERIIYKTNGQTAIGGLSTDSSYYVSTVSPYVVKLHKTLDDAVSGINTVVLSSYGVGNHILQSYNKKSVVGSINITNSGSGYENKKRTLQSSKVNASLSTIEIEDHDYKSGEIVVYNIDGTPISGLTTNTSYYVTTINDDKFRLSQVGVGSTNQDFYYNTKQFVNFNSTGDGTHIFNYPEISVEMVGDVGISSIGSETFKSIIKPIFRGEITSVHLSNNGIGYGSSEILNYNRQPNITLDTGSNAQLTPIVENGKIIDVIINNSGNNYSSSPNISITGSGSGASITPIIQNGAITSVKIINGGIGYLQRSTFITITSPGSSSKFDPKIQTWKVNLFEKYFNVISDDDGILSKGLNKNYQLQYSHLYAPRKLRETVYSVSQNGNILYGIPDLVKVDNIEKLSTRHSPIIGWAYDGNPIYGPYGYITKRGGIISPMKSGYELNSSQQRPNFPPGFFVEDYVHSEKSDETVLDQNNGRFCVTPEFPNGTYAYFATINYTSPDNSGKFTNYRRPVFPYLIGNFFKSVPNEFNFKIASNQDDLDLNKTNWLRFTTPYNIINNIASYEYLSIPNKLNQTVDIVATLPGSIESIGINSGGDGYKIGNSIVFNENGTKGYGAAAKVSKIKGKPITLVSTATSTINNIEFFSGEEKNSFTLYAENPHNLNNNDIISISGLNTTSTSLQLNSYTIGVTTSNVIALGATVGSIAVTGIVTYFSVTGNLNQTNVRENDIFTASTEKIKILNVDPLNSRIRVLRQIDGTVGISHTATEILYANPRKLKITTGITTSYDYKLNRQIYFDPLDSVGLGTIAGVGIGTTLTMSNPGAGITQIFVPTKTIYIPNHKLETGDILTYSPNTGSSIGVSTNGISTSVTLTNQSQIFVAKISEDLIGISTIKVGLGSTGVFVGIASTTNGLSTLFFTGIGTGTYHSFETNYDSITGNISRNLVTVSTSQTHGLTKEDFVHISVNPSISTTFTVKYNDYNRRLIINPKNFISAGVNTSTSSITITNHGFINGQKIIHTSNSPSGNLQNNQIYYVVIVDDNTFKLSNTYYSATSLIPEIVGITTASNGTLSPINPAIQLYKNSTIIFDLSDSSLSYTNQFTTYPAFEFKFYKDSNFTEEFTTSKISNVFEVEKTGTIGITSTAKIVLSINENTSEKLYYNLIPIYDNNIPQVKREIVIDNLIQDYNELQIKSSKYNGDYKISVASSSSFTYNLPLFPESVSYASSTSIISYETTSSSASGPIAKFEIKNKGQNYYSLPGITTITSIFGSNAIIEPSSTSIGRIKRTKISDIGFDFSSDNTVRPTVYLPQIIKVDQLSSFASIGISSAGRAYSSAPKLIAIDGKTKNIISDVDLRYSLGDSQVKILKNTFGINNSLPTIIPIENTNGVGIGTVQFNTVTKIVTVTLSVGFSTANSFPFNVNDKVLIENVSVGVGSTGKGYNSKEYNYNLFTLTSVTPNLGGIGSVSYSLFEFLGTSETPGDYDSTNSSGRIIPQKYFPIFNPVLSKNNFLTGETATSDSSTGIVENWDSKNNLLTVSSSDNFYSGSIIKGFTSKTQGNITSIERTDSFFETGVTSKVEKGWQINAGFLNDNLQKIQDSFYYQNFSYSIKSKIEYNTWNDVVSTLNHTSGFRKFSDYQLESSLPQPNRGALIVGLSTGLTSFETLNTIVGSANLNCVYDFDLVKENSLQIGNSSFSDEIVFASRILADYQESVGNRVLSIDDISSQFNSNPRATRYSDIHRFKLSDARVQKYLIYAKDKRFTDERQCEFVTLLHNDVTGFLNQYSKVYSVNDLGSFDFNVQGTDGILEFYPIKYSVNDYNISLISYNIKGVLSGITSSVNYGGIVNIVGTSVTSVSLGSTCTIVSIANTYTSAKVLVEISGSNGQYEFDELNVIHDGSNIHFLEYGQLTNNSILPYSSPGLGTYNSYFSGSNLIIDFIPNIGLGVTCNTLHISIANTSYTGVGTFDMKYSLLEAKTTSIASSTSPIATPIGQYININSDNFDYDCAHFLVQVSDSVNNHHQLSEVLVFHNSTDTFISEFANIETASGLGTVGVSRTDTFTKITFTPNPNIEVQVKSFMNALQIADEASDITKIDLTNSSIVTNSSTYEGTESTVKRDFNLQHKTKDIFRRTFDGSDPEIVNVLNNTIQIPNHFLVSGEEIVYSNTGIGSTQAIGIASTSFVGIGTTDKLPATIYVVKVSDNLIKLSSSAQNALKPIPEVLNFTSVGIGSSHTLNAINQNAKIIVAIDNIIQSPVVSSAIRSSLSKQILLSENIAFFTGITSFFGGDLIKIDDEIMRIDNVGIGSTNAILLRRPWLGTTVVGHSTGALITKVVGDYNIISNALNFSEAPYGNVPVSSPTNEPDEVDWTGLSASSSFQGRVFLRSGIPNSSDETYHKNYVFSDISNNFNGSENNFTLTSSGSSVTGISNENAIILINDVFQGPGLSADYILAENTGITSVSFTGTASSVSYDVNVSTLPRGGVIISVGSTGGFGYQPLVSAGATATVSSAGTISAISIGNSGSGYRSQSTYEILVDTSFPVGIGSTNIYLENFNSVFSILSLLNTGSNCSVGVGTFIKIGNVITSIGSTFVQIGSASTSQYNIPSGTQAVVKISNPQIGIVKVGVGNSSVGVSTITHIGYSTIISGKISTSVTITNSGSGYTSTNRPEVIIDDPLSYSNIPLIYSASSISGVGSNATANIIVGQGSSVIDFEIVNFGYGYRQEQILTVAIGGTVGIPTTGSASFKEFQLSIQETHFDEFSGWSIGELQILDNFNSLFDGSRKEFQITVSSVPISIRSSPGSLVNVQDVLLIFINDVLQKPGSGYIFNGGSIIAFTEAPKSGDISKILFYKGSGSIDVIDRNILETVKKGDDLTISYDSSRGQPITFQEDERTVTTITSTNTVDTLSYFGPGNTNDSNLLRPVVWCRQTEDKIINEQIIGKDRIIYEPLIYPTTYLIKSVGIGSTVIYVDNIRPFFNPINENNGTLLNLNFQKNITLISQDGRVGATATCIVSSGGTVTSIVISDGGVGYTTTPTISISQPIGFGTTAAQNTALATATISGGVVTGIAVTFEGSGYISTAVPQVLIESPTLISESDSVTTYSGDSGVIVGFGTTTISSIDQIIFDLYIPTISYLRDTSVVATAITVSGIGTGDYFLVYNSNVGVATTSITSRDTNNNVIGIGTNFVDNVYQVESVSNVSVANTTIGIATVGSATTTVRRVFAKISGISTINFSSTNITFDSTVFTFDSTGIGSGSGYSGGITTSNYFGNFSWGKIQLTARTEENEFNFYGNVGVGGISTSAYVIRTVPLKFLSYT